MTTRKAISLIPQARVILAKKRFAKARYLAKKMNITCALAGQILAVLPEWINYTKRHNHNVWVRGALEW